MVEISLAALLFSLLPFFFHHLDASPSFTWRCSSGLLAVFLVLEGVIGTRRIRGRASRERGAISTPVSIVSYSVLAIGIAAQLVNVARGGSFGAYLLGIGALVVLSSIYFARLLFIGVSSEDG